MELTSLRWDIDETSIVFFPDDDEATTRTSPNGAIINAQLTSVSQSSDLVFANFSSILTVNSVSVRAAKHK